MSKKERQRIGNLLVWALDRIVKFAVGALQFRIGLEVVRSSWPFVEQVLAGPQNLVGLGFTIGVLFLLVDVWPPRFNPDTIGKRWNSLLDILISILKFLIKLSGR